MRALSLAALLAVIPLSAMADGSVVIKMNFVDENGIGASAGTVTADVVHNIQDGRKYYASGFSIPST